MFSLYSVWMISGGEPRAKLIQMWCTMWSMAVIIPGLRDLRMNLDRSDAFGVRGDIGYHKSRVIVTELEVGQPDL